MTSASFRMAMQRSPLRGALSSAEFAGKTYLATFFPNIDGRPANAMWLPSSGQEWCRWDTTRHISI